MEELNIDQPSPFQETLNAFNEAKKKFLEQESNRFYKAYCIHRDKRMLKIYKRLLHERVKCRI